MSEPTLELSFSKFSYQHEARVSEKNMNANHVAEGNEAFQGSLGERRHRIARHGYGYQGHYKQNGMFGGKGQWLHDALDPVVDVISTDNLFSLMVFDQEPVD